MGEKKGSEEGVIGEHALCIISHGAGAGRW